ncbi:MAG: hypothetical protein LC623_07035 [Halobacteriales archaeon]|nr:hypothetical protein [Halobacteriales archaeon]
MKSLGVLALLTLAALAGCVSSNDSGSTTTGSGPHASAVRFPTPPDTMMEGAGHDHTNPAQHKTLWNYAFASRDPLLQNAADAAGLHAMDLQAGWLFGAVYGSHGASVDGGVQIWDAHTDPLHPKQVGKWTIPGSVGGDRSIGATPDGDFAVIGLEPVDCLGHVNPLGAVTSAYLIDARDKALPKVADVLTPAGTTGSPGQNTQHTSTHSIYVHRIHGKDYAFIFGDIYRIDRSEQGAKLVFVASVSTGHDIYVRDTPWNATWALSADGQGGMVVVDVSDPAKPFTIGQWDLANRADLAKEQGDYYFHTADVDFVGGQTLIVMTSEDFAPHVSPFWVLDGNPLRAVERGGAPVNLGVLGEWHNPYNHTAANIRFSLHNPRFHDGGILTISSYHAGFFQLDLRDPSFWEHPSLIADGAYADGMAPLLVDPVESAVEDQLCGLGVSIDAPEQMDVAMGQHGVMYLADVFMGLYTFKPTDDHPVYGTHPVAPVLPG